MSDRVIIEVRANEYRFRDYGDTPWNRNVPYAPGQIATDAVQCEAAGASILHFHAREPGSGKASADPSLYAETVRACRQKTTLVIMPTNIPATGDIAGINTVNDRVAPILQTAKDPMTKMDL